MKDDKRRKALKVLALTAPAVWVSPVVKSSTLPPPGMTTGCLPGCYSNGEESIQITVAGVGILTDVSRSPSSTECDASPPQLVNVVMAPDLATANEIVVAEIGEGCTAGGSPYTLEGSICSLWFYGC